MKIMYDACLIPTALSEISVSENKDREKEVLRLWRLQSDTMKQAIINVMKATIGEYE